MLGSSLPPGLEVTQSKGKGCPLAADPRSYRWLPHMSSGWSLPGSAYLEVELPGPLPRRGRFAMTMDTLPDNFDVTNVDDDVCAAWVSLGFVTA